MTGLEKNSTPNICIQSRTSLINQKNKIENWVLLL